MARFLAPFACALVGALATAQASAITETATNIGRAALAEIIAASGDLPPDEMDELISEAEGFAVAPQTYLDPSIGRRRAQYTTENLGGGVQSAFSATGSANNVNVPTGSAYEPIRVHFATDRLFPTEANPMPDGDRSCYSAGQWFRRGSPEGSSPVLEDPNPSTGCTGTCVLCTASAKHCWDVCTAENVVSETNLAHIQSLIDQAGTLLSSMLEVQPILSDLALETDGLTCYEYEMENYPSFQGTDLVIFVHARPPKTQDSSAAAYASPCQKDQHGRAISGGVGFTGVNSMCVTSVLRRTPAESLTLLLLQSRRCRRRPDGTRGLARHGPVEEYMGARPQRSAGRRPQSTWKRPH